MHREMTNNIATMATNQYPLIFCIAQRYIWEWTGYVKNYAKLVAIPHLILFVHESTHSPSFAHVNIIIVGLVLVGE